jgi:2-C-methyl-D-erythritol 2,4-cyclodiphosphate synthase
MESGMESRVGIGFDVHKFVTGRPLMLGGVEIPFHLGLLGHSDADVLLHAVADALLGAIGKGDIGIHFPDWDESLKGTDSSVIILKIIQMLKDEGGEVIWLDSIVIAEQPKISPFVLAIKSKIASLLAVPESRISVKGKTCEGLGFIGRNEGIAAQAAVTIRMRHE